MLDDWNHRIHQIAVGLSFKIRPVRFGLFLWSKYSVASCRESILNTVTLHVYIPYAPFAFDIRVCHIIHVLCEFYRRLDDAKSIQLFFSPQDLLYQITGILIAVPSSHLIAVIGKRSWEPDHHKVQTFHIMSDGPQ